MDAPLHKLQTPYCNNDANGKSCRGGGDGSSSGILGGLRNFGLGGLLNLPNGK